jgi:hypothetical protein
MQAQVQGHLRHMEDAMLIIRIVAAGAFLLSLPLIAGGSTTAQATAGAEPGKPLQLVQLANRPGKAKAKPHVRIAHHLGKVHFAAAKTHRIHSQTSHADEAAEAAKTAPAADAERANVWPGAPTGPAPTSVAAGLAMQAPPSAVPAPSELVVGGRTVDVVASDQANEIDLAANAPQTAAVAPPQDDVAANKPAAATAFVAGAPDEAAAVGSTSWIAQVLAALGGAVAAGSVAWFLIGAAPQRTYS